MNTATITGPLFILTSAFTVWMFFRAIKNNGFFLISALVWMVLLGVLAYVGLFTDTSSLPPKVILAPVTAIIILLSFFLTKNGRSFIRNMDLTWLTWLHVVRIPVELVLYSLAMQKLIPELMTFEGNNPDILSGITAPIAVFLFIKKDKIKRTGLLIWNLICLALLVNIVILAALSVASPMQQFAFEQPNVAILDFPYIWLPGIVVPLVMFSHLAAIYKIIAERK